VKLVQIISRWKVIISELIISEFKNENKSVETDSRSATYTISINPTICAVSVHIF
jgi:hypothetical protein